jgi:CheY-like chemotaxis protein
MVRALTKLRVLVVEDDADNAESLALLLRLWGHEVQVCRTGAEALSIAPRYAPQAVLLDIGLPGMSGWEVARQIRGFGPIVLIGLSGFGMQQDHQRASQEGLDHFLVKPADPEELERLLCQAGERAEQGTTTPVGREAVAPPAANGSGEGPSPLATRNEAGPRDGQIQGPGERGV